MGWQKLSVKRRSTAFNRTSRAHRLPRMATRNGRQLLWVRRERSQSPACATPAADSCAAIGRSFAQRGGQEFRIRHQVGCPLGPILRAAADQDQHRVSLWKKGPRNHRVVFIGVKFAGYIVRIPFRRLAIVANHTPIAVIHIKAEILCHILPLCAGISDQDGGMRPK